MKLSNNTIFVTGGGSGIGRGLAESLHKLGNKVIISGRRHDVLYQTVKANPGMEFIVLDVSDSDSIRDVAVKVVQEYPDLNVLINNAGILKVENLKKFPGKLKDSEAVIITNLLGPIRLTAALLPHLQKQPESAIINVSSGLGFVPLPVTPTYSATKAALHSYTVSLRVELAGTPVEVIEIIPPAVATDLTPGRLAGDPHIMSLSDYIKQTMQILQQKPTPAEVCVESVKFLRFAEATGNYEEALQQLSTVIL
ncbi:MAG TPA: SDR family NAD(P)-dependent oxidoreductase [Chthoniobacterales bacterium]|nr:SDR family NAD(P)-dependent oxidoreductase [Chthoniobacterales bacterium]